MSAAEVLGGHRCRERGMVCDEGELWCDECKVIVNEDDVATHQLDALKAAGYAAVVKLPESDEFGEWSIDGEDEFSVSPVPLMELASGDMQMGCQIAWGEIVLNLSVSATQQLAAVLLAVAASAGAAEADR